jgi:CDP-glycerol glycerophosphotransferase (TagB/SpsB family)
MQRLLSYSLAFLSRFLLFPLYALSFLVPRRQTLWVFGSWGGYRYADNAAAFFEYCNRRLGGEFDLVWISRRRDIVLDLRARGLRAEWIYSPAGILCSLRAGRYLFDCFVKDINFWTSGGARLINLWSGVPLKTFERDIDHVANRYYQLFHGPLPVRLLYGMMMPWHLRRPHRIIAMSDETAEITRRAFDVAAEQVLVTGFPRNDALLQPSPATRLPAVMQQALDAGQRMFVYLPTFRDSGKPFVQLDWERLDAHMAKLDAVFFCKFHPVDRSQIPQGFERIRSLPQDLDVYSVLPFADALVSDYSSIIFDYMLLERPIIYYAPDIDEFASQNRSLNFDPREIAVGPVCRSFEELLSSLSKLQGDATEAQPAVDEEHREAVFARLHRYRDARSCQRLLQALAECEPLTVSVARERSDAALDAEELHRSPQQGE